MPRHRRRWLVVLALVLTAAGGTGSYLLAVSADERVEVLVAARAIGWGEVISDGDLDTAKVAVEGSAGRVVPAGDMDRVVGRTAAGSVPAGGLLAPGHIGEHGVPGPGEVLVGLRAEPGGVPARGLGPGEVVHVVPITEDAPSGTESGFEARVLDTGAPNAQGVVVVDVVVSDAAADRAMAAAAGRVLFVLRGRG